MTTIKRFFVIFRYRDGSEERAYYRQAHIACEAARSHGTADVCSGGDVLREYKDGAVVAETDQISICGVPSGASCPLCSGTLTDEEICSLWAARNSSKRKTKAGGRNGGRPKKTDQPTQQ